MAPGVCEIVLRLICKIRLALMPFMKDNGVCAFYRLMNGLWKTMTMTMTMTTTIPV